MLQFNPVESTGSLEGFELRHQETDFVKANELGQLVIPFLRETGRPLGVVWRASQFMEQTTTLEHEDGRLAIVYQFGHRDAILPDEQNGKTCMSLVVITSEVRSKVANEDDLLERELNLGKYAAQQAWNVAWLNMMRVC